MKLNELRDNPGARRPKKRVGRGIGSGMGKTSTAGQKGQKARSGVAINGFEGGQMPIYRRLPRRGFTARNKIVFQSLNLDRLQKAIDEKRIDASGKLDLATLAEGGLVRRTGNGVKLLGNGSISAKVDLVVAAASKSAVEAVEKAGGSVTIVEQTREPAPAGE